MSRICHVLLAAGKSKRMGTPKQLLPWGAKTLIEFQIERILPTTEQLFIITGAFADQIEPLLKGYSLEVLRCEDWENGMGDSLGFGIRTVLKMDASLDGVLISLIDQPLVTSEHYYNMRALFQKGQKQIIASESDFGWSGAPVLFDAHYFGALQKLNGEEVAKKIIKKNSQQIIYLNGGSSLVDMDTPEVYRELLKEFNPQ